LKPKQQAASSRV